MRQGVRLEPLLEAISKFLDSQHEMIERVRRDLVVQAAVGLGLEDGAKLRVDTTVVETDIHHPTDNTLLWDVVRVVTRLVGRLAKALKMRRIRGFRDRRRSARHRMYEIQRMTTRQRQEHQTTIYPALIGIAEDVVASAKTALEKTATMRGKDLLAAMAIEGHPRRDRALLRSRQAGDRSGAPPRARWRAGPQCRENLFDLRAPYRPDQTRQGAHARGIRPQGVSCRKRKRFDHPV